jgi:HPt (histidine-containing phosphotransfer) domain-containing protein
MAAYLFLFMIIVVLAFLIYLENRQTQSDEKKEEERLHAEQTAKNKKEAAQRKAKEEAKRIAAEAEKAKQLHAEQIAQKEAAQRKAKEEAERIAAEAEELLQPIPEYSHFDHSRLLDMGLSDTEAKEFVQELIPQVETQLPLLEKALQAEEPDFETMEHLTHSIKGSSTNIGTGGIADLLTDYNTYLKSGNSTVQAQAYLKALYQELERLKAQYL